MQMTSELDHRGPDERGIYLDNQIGLGHTRLSIIDIDSGAQPISNEDETKWLVFNGEIFNYIELKAELLKSGHRFKTKSDAEVLLHLYEDHGEECLQKLNGQFAFAIWDNVKKELFLARDRVGIRPLYFTFVKDCLLFASEIKAILKNNSVDRNIDAIAIDQIFTFWTTLPEQTPFLNIKELRAGHYLKVSNGSVRIQRYWHDPFYPAEDYFKSDPVNLVDELRSLIIDAVKIRLRADVKVGTYLSGGLDSSGISSLVAKYFDQNLSTFGIRFENENFDEGHFQHEVSNYLKTKHTDILATDENIGVFFPDVIRHCEKPILRTSPVPLYLLSKKVKKNGIKVVLTGEGADEYFGGYNIFREMKARLFWSKQPNSKWRSKLIEKLYPFIFKDSRQKALMTSFFAKNLEDVNNPFYSHLIRWMNTARLKTFFSDELKAAIGNYNGIDQLHQDLPEHFNKWDNLSKAQYLESAIFMSNYLLSSQGDRVAMANSVEIRLPFLDMRILEFLGRISPNLKIKGLNEKYIMKKCFADLLPKKILSRTKHPYRAPIRESLLNKKNEEYVTDTLSQSALEEAGIFNPIKVNRLIQKIKAANFPNEIEDMGLVGILSTQLFHNQFIQRQPETKKPIPEKWRIFDFREKSSRA